MYYDLLWITKTFSFFLILTKMFKYHRNVNENNGSDRRIIQTEVVSTSDCNRLESESWDSFAALGKNKIENVSKTNSFSLAIVKADW